MPTPKAAAVADMARPRPDPSDHPDNRLQLLHDLTLTVSGRVSAKPAA
ncbi:MAG: hypothetical protein ACOVQ8_13510 [Elstera sp.]